MNKLKKIRSTLNLTQEELGQMFGITPRAISNYEAGRRIPKYEILLKYSRIARRNNLNFDLESLNLSRAV